jgi:glutamyl-tRNA synthetase
VKFQLDTADTARELAQQLLSEGKAYEDEGAIRFRQPKEGTVSWNDAVRGEIEFKNELLPDLVIVRSDGRPTYNFISPVDDITDGITHVIRGEDHVSNTPSQINILRALGADLPTYAHVPNINGSDGRKLSKRRNAVALDDFRNEGYLPAALFNFLALLGWSYDDKTTLMSRHELVERFSLERIVPSPATFDYQKLDWMNGMYLRDLQPDEYALDLLRWLREQGIDWPEEHVRATVPIVQEKIEKFSQYPDFVRFLFEPIEPPAGLDVEILRAAHERLATLEPWDASVIDAALRALADELGQKPRQAFQPIRLAVTGSKISPGLFESLELLGKDESLKRLSAAAAAPAA